MSASELESSVWGDSSELPDHLLSLSNEELRQHIRAIDNEVRIMKSEINRIKHETSGHNQHIKENKEKIKVNKQLPYLVANVVELVEPYVDPKEDDGSATDLSVTSTMRGN
jgi:26S proteasome regulatory subunit T5